MYEEVPGIVHEGSYASSTHIISDKNERVRVLIGTYEQDASE